MAIRKMRVSFDIELSTFLQFVAATNQSMHIDVYGDQKPPKGMRQLNGAPAPKLLAAPRSSRGGNVNRGADANGNKVTAYTTMLALFVANKDRSFTPVDLQPAITAIGLSPKSVSPQLTKLRQDGYIKKGTDGLYRATPRGIAHQEKLAAASRAEA